MELEPRSVTPFVPRWLRARLVADPSSVLPGLSIKLSAAILFADLSDFTALTEALTRTGAEGVEELDRLLNTVFTALIDAIHALGGDVVRFGGDALTVLFPVESSGAHHTLQSATRHARGCALAMQRVMHDFQSVPTRAGVFALRLKIGIASGDVRLCILGFSQCGLDLVITGPALNAATRLRPRPGQVLTGRGAGRILKISPCLRRPLVWTEVLPPIESLMPFIPPVVRDRLCAGPAAFLCELRRVSVLFVEFDAGEDMQDYFVAAQTIVAQAGGWLSVDVADKGSVLIALFGAPIALGDESARAVACVRALLQDTRTRRIGVSSGQVFAGTLGSPERQAYTVLGSEMNVAARLMEIARDGTILASGRIQTELAGRFEFGTQRLIALKGKDKPVPVFEVLGARERIAQPTIPLVGRMAELAQADALIESVRQGCGAVLRICGEAGIGKSRLAEEIARRATQRGLSVHIGNCRVDGQAIAYLPWRGLLRSLTGLTPQAHRTTVLAYLTQWLESENPDLLPRLPLLGDVLGVNLRDTDLTRHLDARLRQQSTHALLIDLLRARTGGGLVLLIEDAHWADALSLDLALAVARACADAPLLIMLIHRPIEEPKPAVWVAYDGLPHGASIALDELGREETLALAMNKLGVRELPAELSEWLVQKSHGRPFFAEELLGALRDARVLQIYGERVELAGALVSVSVPDTVYGVVQARIDRLNEAIKLTLKVAAVVGRVFRVDALRGAYPFEIVPATLDAHLDVLERLDIAPLERPEPGRAYRFKHAITHEVAYGTLTFAQRRRLHAAVAQWYESAFSANLDPQIPLLAYHWARTNEFEPAARYSLAAGDQARARYANEAALQLYAQVIDVLERSEQPASDPPTSSPITPAARARLQSSVWMGLSDVRFVIGQYDQAREGYERALQSGVLTHAERADVYRRLGRVAEYKAQYARALDDLQRGLAELEQPSGEIAARLYVAGGLVYFRQGEMAHAREWCERGIALAADAEARAESAQGYNLLGMIQRHQGRFDEAMAHLEASIRLYHELGDLLGEARASNNLAVALWQQGRWADAQPFFESAQHLYQRVGDANGAATVANNLGELYLVRGDLSAAMVAYGQALTAWQRLGHRNGIALAMNNLSQVAMRENKWREALSYLERARDLAAQVGAQSLLPELYRHSAEAYLGLDQSALAREFADRAVETASALSNRFEEGAARRVLGCVLIASGDLRAAEENLQESLVRLEPLGNHYEIALTLAQLARVKRRVSDDATAVALRERARTIFQELGARLDLEQLE